MYLQGYAEEFADFLADKVTHISPPAWSDIVEMEMRRAIQLSRNSLTLLFLRRWTGF